MPFSFRRLSKFQLLAFCLVAVLAIGGLGLSNLEWFNRKSASAGKMAATQNAVAAAAEPKKLEYVRQGRLWPQLRKAFQALGDRLERPGKERVVLVGTLSRASKGTTNEPVRLIFESATKLRVEERDGVTIINDNDLKASKGALKKEEQDEIESLFFDTADNFFAGQMRGQATRFIGDRFQGAGASYDLYQVNERIALGKAVRQLSKFFYFNSETQLLEQVQYQIERDGKPIKVEVKIGQWQKVNGQNFPGNFVRLENGSPVLTLSITSASVVAKSDDGIFGRF